MRRINYIPTTKTNLSISGNLNRKFFDSHTHTSNSRNKENDTTRFKLSSSGISSDLTENFTKYDKSNYANSRSFSEKSSYEPSIDIKFEKYKNKMSSSKIGTTARKGRKTLNSTVMKNSNYQEQEYAVSVIENYAREVGISAFNLRTMELFITQFIDNEAYVNTITMINFWRPLELVMNQKSENSCLHLLIRKIFKNCYVGFLPRKNFSEDMGKDIYLKSGNKDLNIEELNTKYVCMASLSGLVSYLDQNSNYIQTDKLFIKYHYLENHLNISFQSTIDLELLFNSKFNKSYGSLLSLFNCKTISGVRLLRSNILQPLSISEDLRKRYQAVKELRENNDAFNHIREYLGCFKELEIFTSKFMHRLDEPSEGIIKQVLTSVNGIRNCLRDLMTFKEIMKSKLNSELFLIMMKCFDDKVYLNILDKIEDYVSDIDISSIKLSRKNDSIFFIIKEGQNNVLDVSRKTYSDTVNEIYAEFEKLKTQTNDPGIKLCYNESKGYYVTLGERYFNEADFVISKKVGRKVMCSNIALVSLSERIKEIKRDLVDISMSILNEVVEMITKNINYLFVLSSYIALLDVLCAFAEYSNNGIRTTFPIINNNKDSFFFAKNCRHPLLEKHLNSNEISGNFFVPNDYFFTNHFNILLLKGPNASGKTTYMKQMVLNLILAQIGCPVPCDYFEFTLRKFVFTKFDSHDNTGDNKGTFINQIIEIQKVITNHGNNSLILLDEPFEASESRENFALSISMLDHFMLNFNKSFIIISSHNSSLSQLSSFYFNVMIGTMVVQFQEDTIDFLFKFQFNNPTHHKTGTSRNNISLSKNEDNYGILLANMLGYNKELIEKAIEISKLEFTEDINLFMEQSDSISTMKLFLFKTLFELYDLRCLASCYVIEDEVLMKKKSIISFINHSLNF